MLYLLIASFIHKRCLGRKVERFRIREGHESYQVYLVIEYINMKKRCCFMIVGDVGHGGIKTERYIKITTVANVTNHKIERKIA